MGCLTDYAENKLLDHILGNTVYNRPATLYLALTTTNPGEAAVGASLTEPAGNGYSRKAINSWATASSRATSNEAQVDFDEATGSWGTIAYWAIVDSATVGQGNVLAYGALTESKTIGDDDNFYVEAGECDISVAAGGMSDYMANAILDHLLEGTAYTPGSKYLAACTAEISDSDTGSTITEPEDTYERKATGAWDAAYKGASANTSLISFPKASAGYGTVSYVAVVDDSTGGNILWHGEMTTPKGVGQSDVLKYAAGAITISLD